MEANYHKEIEHLIQNIPTISLATVDESQIPHASLLPFVWHQSHGLMVFASALSPHTTHLKHNPSCSVLIYDSVGVDPFALKRMQLKCFISQIATTHKDYNSILDQMHTKLGPTVSMLRSLPDFTLFALRPESGRLILGFGKAYHLQGFPITVIEHIKK